MTRRAFDHLTRSGDPEALLRRAGLTLQGIEDPQARIGVESQIAFMKLASEALDDPLLGFHLAESFEPRELGLLYYVQASSASLGEALGRVALMAYSADQNELFRRAAVYVDRLLKGDHPGDLPVQQATKFELNLHTAKALGIEIPPSLLARADKVIE